MAFYSARVDDDGNEIERRLSARSPQSSLSSGSSNQNGLSSRSNNSKIVCYVNSAACIEKNSDQSDLDNSIDLLSDRKVFTNRSSRASDTSMISNDMISERKFYTHRISPTSGQNADAAASQLDMKSGSNFLTHRVSHDGRSDIVPPLDLVSEKNYEASARGYTISYNKHCEPAKVQSEVAYQKWLSAKRKTLSEEAARRKKAEEAKRKMEEERRQLADRKFQEWLAKKARKTAAVVRHPSDPLASAEPVQVAGKHVTQLKMNESEAQAKLDDWKRKKEAIDEERRAKKRHEEERLRVLQEERRRVAEEAFRKWSVDAGKKPKPVPLNRGIETLRGTVSDIYVNPNEWQGILDEEDLED